MECPSGSVTAPLAHPFPVVIVGAGIGGLALSLFLAARNIPSHLFERETAFGEAGNGLQLGPNVNALLRTIPQLDKAIASKAYQPDALFFCDGITGTHLNALPLGQKSIQRWGAPFRVIHRADLHNVLVQAAQENPLITLHSGYTLDDVSSEENTVRLTFNDHAGSKKHVEAALVVGADGVRSKLRTTVDSTPPHITHQTAWRALIPAADFPLPWGHRNTGLWMAPDMHLVHYPVRQGTFINAVVTAPSTIKNLVNDNRFGKEARRILKAAGDTWTPWPLMTHKPLFGAQRIFLIGDAAHAMLPHLAQGAAQAIEDAACLAALFASGMTSIADLQEAYAANREARVRAIQKDSARKGRIYQMAPPLAYARNLVLRATPASVLMRSMDWLFRLPPQR